LQKKAGKKTKIAQKRKNATTKTAAAKTKTKKVVLFLADC
jgi:hypothetical protein